MARSGLTYFCTSNMATPILFDKAFNIKGSGENTTSVPVYIYKVDQPANTPLQRISFFSSIKTLKSKAEEHSLPQQAVIQSHNKPPKAADLDHERRTNTNASHAASKGDWGLPDESSSSPWPAAGHHQDEISNRTHDSKAITPIYPSVAGR
eukprot:scaffold13930_cov34-Prasinocladus_malaysianus.AAC.1